MSTTTEPPVSRRPDRTIFFLPWLKLCNKYHNRRSFAIANANVLPDDDDTWSHLLKLPRPPWMKIFRELPLRDRTEGEPARGTLIICDGVDNDQWLADHIDRFIGILFVLAADRGKWRTPSEAFRYYQLTWGEQPSEGVQFRSKTSTYIEDEKGFAIFPGLELRGVNRSIALEFDSGWQKELLDRFVINPYDRIATACYHLMRAQFQDPFTSSAEQDFASFCASIEASLDLSEQDYATKMQDELEHMLFASESLRRWVAGLYAVRSIHNHGVKSDAINNPNDSRAKNARYFLGRSGSWDLARHIAIQCIISACNASAGDEGELGFPTESEDAADRFFRSDDRWAKFQSHFKCSGDVDRLVGLTEQPMIDFINDCRDFAENHDWQMMDAIPTKEKINKLLKAMLAVYGTLKARAEGIAKDAEAKLLFDEVGESLTPNLQAWFNDNYNFSVDIPPTLQQASKVASLHLFEFYVDPAMRRKWGFRRFF